MVTSEMQRAVREAVFKLKPKYQTVIALRYFEGKSLKEISAITGRREGTVRSQMHRAIEQLEKILARHNQF